MLYKYIWNYIKYSIGKKSELLFVFLLSPVLLIFLFSSEYSIIITKEKIISQISINSIMIFSYSFYLLLSFSIFLVLKPKICTLSVIKNIEKKYILYYTIFYLSFHLLIDLASNWIILSTIGIRNFLPLILSIYFLPIIYFWINKKIGNIILARITYIVFMIFSLFIIWINYIIIFLVVIILGIYIILNSKKWLFTGELKSYKSYKKLSIYNIYFVYLIRDFYFFLYFPLLILSVFLIKFNLINILYHNLYFIQIIQFSLSYFLGVYWTASNIIRFESDRKLREIFIISVVVFIKVMIILLFEFTLSFNLSMVSLSSTINFLFISIISTLLNKFFPKVIIEIICMLFLYIFSKYILMTELYMFISTLLFYYLTQYYENK